MRPKIPSGHGSRSGRSRRHSRISLAMVSISSLPGVRGTSTITLDIKLLNVKISFVGRSFAMSRILLKNGHIVTVDGARAVHPGGFVAVDNGRIVAVGPAGALPQALFDQPRFDEVIDVAGCVVLPGLINTHQHHWYALFK